MSNKFIALNAQCWQAIKQMEKLIFILSALVVVFEKFKATGKKKLSDLLKRLDHT